jgi:UDP-glucose 4-epimerase
MRILITGGAGFIASHVVDAYVKVGHHVAVLDDLSSGFRRNLNPKAKFYKADIRDARAVNRIIKRERPDIVNHHAAMISVIESLRRPDAVFETNVLGTAHLAQALGALPHPSARKFIFASTGGALYGEPKHIPAKETAPLLPLAPYGLSKALAEDVLRYYARMFGFGHTILRYPNIYGPRQNPKGEAGVVAIFCGLMKRGKRPTIFGDGTKARDYVYVQDVARANMAALRRGTNATVNLGWGKTVSDREIFEAVAKAVGFSGKPIYAPYRTGEVYRISLDAKKARRVLGWKPRVMLAEGIRRTVATL